MKKRISATLPFLIFALLLSGCKARPIPEEAVWHGSLELVERVNLPFRMVLDLKSPHPSGYFVVGDERTPIPEIYLRKDSLFLEFSEYGAAMRGVWRNKRLSGQYLRFRRDTAALPFSALPHQPAMRQAVQREERSKRVPLVGRFQVYFRGEEVIDSSTTATFWTRGDSTFGTFISPDGDHGLMAGTFKGDTLELGRFTGWQANKLELRRANGSWIGLYFIRNLPPRFFTLAPRAVTPKKSATARTTTVRNPRKPFEFSGRTIAGDTLRNTDSRFKGKVVLVDIMGTWCHNCMDAAPLLQQLHSEFQENGLEVVALSFELLDDANLARKNLMLYQERFGITFPLLFCGTTEKENVDARLRSQLNDFFAYPTTLFLDRKGIVRHIHAGFKGPALGEEYQQQVEEYYNVVKKLIAEK